MDCTEIFFNTRIEGQGTFSEIGNLCLTPYRYLFGGRTVQIIDADALKGIHHVASFHCLGDKNQCPTNPNLHSADMNLFYTAFAIALFIPGLILGTLFKALDYAFNDAEEASYRHVWMDVVSRPLNQGFNEALQAASDAFGNILSGRAPAEMDMVDMMMPKDDDLDWAWKSRILQIKTIGSPKAPIEKQMDLDREVSQLDRSPTDILVIFGNNRLQIAHDPGIYDRNPMKVVLVGAKMGGEGIASVAHRLDGADIPQLASVLRQSGKWQRRTATSMKQAMQANNPMRECLPFKQWHMVYEVNATQKASIALARPVMKHFGPGPSGGDGKGKKAGFGANVHTIHD